ncbi:putative thioredoxin domain protein [Gregarina niphandrodes]|uniref:Thioredoxin domain protein n=1 Tax=Gregarina niphandrodes TaxID=110365 RepID=A0A023B8A9_GRENI|nr:putative thioredoxin domain protein [Gregarina niphandrodes]EZG68559.1 putative thioredoxin domain protein [Gregarina niphandrodes]|eukprot:XP_011134566.1 putative thioredoxin domain protein [Gregarina niphandrodes]
MDYTGCIVYYHGELMCVRDSQTKQSWCPDCVELEERVCQAASKRPAKLVQVSVGDRPTWKDPECSYRKAPFNLTEIPTLVQYDTEGHEVKRLVCDDIKNESKLQQFFE